MAEMNDDRNRDYGGEQLRRLYDQDLGEQVRALRQLVIELMTEVEALRALQLSRGPEEVASYRRVYENTCLESHNSAGPYTGMHRTLWAWYGRGPVPAMAFDGRTDHVRREIALLRRMGATEQELQSYVERVAEHESRT